MMNYYCKFAYSGLGVLLLFIQVANAQLETLGFHFQSARQKNLKITFQQYNNLIVVPVQINQSETLNFVLDTGVGYTLITDPSLLKTLKLDCNRRVKVSGSGVGQELQGCITQCKSIKLNKDIVASNHNIIILEEDVLHLSSYAGIKIHGLIGYDLFSRFVVKINYPSKLLHFVKPDAYTYKPRRKEEIFPISIEQMKPYLLAEAVMGSNITNNPATLKLILDTGAGHSLSLDRGTHPYIQVPEKNIPTYLGMTLNGAVEGAVGRIDKFKIGSFELQKVITSFPDTASLKFVRGLSERHGNVGCGVLKRFHITFDYPHKRLILKPNRNFKEPFDFNTSGIEVIAEGADFKTYVIGSVRKNSPAEEAGLKKGDVLLAVDDTMVEGLTLSELYKYINKKEGRRAILFIKRKEPYFTKDIFFIVEVRLKQPI